MNDDFARYRTEASLALHLPRYLLGGHAGTDFD